MYVSTAFIVYITDNYFPHIENKKLSNVRNLRYHGNNTIKLSEIRLKYHFQSKSSYDRKSTVPIHNSTPGKQIQKTKINIVVLILCYHGNKTSFCFWCVSTRYLSSYICEHVIFYLPYTSFINLIIYLQQQSI